MRGCPSSTFFCDGRGFLQAVRNRPTKPRDDFATRGFWHALGHPIFLEVSLLQLDPCQSKRVPCPLQ